MTGGKVALITGAGSGVGAAAARALSEHGWRLVLVGRRQARLAETAEQIKTEVLTSVADVTIAADVQRVFGTAVQRFEKIDLLFNNAGIAAPSIAIEDLSAEEIALTIATNVTGYLLCSAEAFRHMKAQSPEGGRIINNGSVSAFLPRPWSAPYTASKHAVTGLTKALALDGRPHSIAVGQIDIGNAATDMTARMAEGVLQANGTIAPEPRIDIDLVGRTVAFMAGLPPDANIPFLTLMATGMPLYGRG